MTFSDLDEAKVEPVARRLYGALVHRLQPANPLLLRTGVEEGDALYGVLRSLEFRDYRRVYRPVFDVSAFDLSRLAEAEHAAAALGYEFVRLADLELTLELERQLYDLHTEVYIDTSTVVRATPEQFRRAEWLEAFVYSDDMIPEAFFIAVKDDEFAGFSNLFWGEATGELETGTFGAKRAYRHHHRETMLAVKAQEITYAKERGYRTIRTEIGADNPWTLHLCAELPFVQGRDFISMVRVTNWTVEPQIHLTPVTSLR